MFKVNAISRRDKKLGAQAPLSFTVNAGEALAIMGESGSGKSLLLRALADIDPAEGEVFLNDIERNQITAPEWRKKVAYIAPDAGWWLDMVFEHYQNPEQVLPKAIALGLPEDVMRWEITRISNGEKQRLSLLRALENNPDVLLLDEPTSALDESNTERVEKLIKNFISKDKHLVISTHDPQQAARFSSKVLRIAGGNFISEEQN